MNRETVAVVGGGVAGLTAAYLLRKRYNVILFEAGPALGGHADTRRVRTPDGAELCLDTGFLVHNQSTYPNLVGLFAELGVTTGASEMSMSVRCGECGLEYAGGKRGIGLLASGGAATRARYLRMLTEIPRFNRAARSMLVGPDTPGAAEGGEATLGSMLEAGGYSRYFADHYVLPLVGAVWSAGAATSRDYPARYLFRFLANHGLLSSARTRRWRYVVGGSHTYVTRIARTLPPASVAVAVRTVHRHADGVTITDDTGTTHHADRVVLATHADQALGLLADPTATEKRVLGAFTYTPNQMTLHTDATLLPSRPNVRASWNHIQSSCHGDRRVSISYHLNRLMRLCEPLDYVVTLNGAPIVDESAVLATAEYAHPVFDRASVAAQRDLSALTSARTAFAGSYHGWGFHEDACRSGVRAAEAFGARW